ncbi:hypothetical protein, partial [Thiocapsa sp.]|uniref:hypothetical protein n=1 Tax=Thiocapsa sp. TaxID=2024551 RepID=UPI0035943E73
HHHRLPGRGQTHASPGLPVCKQTVFKGTGMIRDYLNGLPTSNVREPEYRNVLIKIKTLMAPQSSGWPYEQAPMSTESEIRAIYSNRITCPPNQDFEAAHVYSVLFGLDLNRTRARMDYYDLIATCPAGSVDAVMAIKQKIQLKSRPMSPR